MRLSDATLPRLPGGVAGPGYDRGRVQPGIVHLGIGAFHRAHQAVCTDDALRAGDLRWGMIGASLRSTATRDALAPQDGLYTVNIRSGTDALRVVGAVQRLLVAPEGPAALVAAMAAPATRIVSLTITEKGYALDPATGGLDAGQPDVAHDLAHPQAPRSAAGFIVAALARRRAEGLPPFTVLSCDNLADNGGTLHRILSGFAARLDPGLGAWVRDRVACPGTMVDRIVPATTDADRARIDASLGLHDAWPVVAEPFLQWVIEDRFPEGRPDWAAHGATMTTDVAPFEAMKLRLLNASHSALAYLGLRAGHETVADAVADPALRAFALGLMQDAAETLTLGAGTDVAGYQQALLARFTNPALRHRLAQIAMDGSQKLPPRLLAAMADRVGRGLPVDRHATAVAAWMRHVAEAAELQDPRAEELRRAVRDGGPMALLEVEAVFGPALPAQAAVRDALARALAALPGRERRG